MKIVSARSNDTCRDKPEFQETGRGHGQLYHDTFQPGASIIHQSTTSDSDTVQPFRRQQLAMVEYLSTTLHFEMMGSIIHRGGHGRHQQQQHTLIEQSNDGNKEAMQVIEQGQRNTNSENSSVKRKEVKHPEFNSFRSGPGHESWMRDLRRIIFVNFG